MECDGALLGFFVRKGTEMARTPVKRPPYSTGLMPATGKEQRKWSPSDSWKGSWGKNVKDRTALANVCAFLQYLGEFISIYLDLFFPLSVLNEVPSVYYIKTPSSWHSSLQKNSDTLLISVGRFTFHLLHLAFYETRIQVKAGIGVYSIGRVSRHAASLELGANGLT